MLKFWEVFMSEEKVNMAICVICSGKLMFRSADVFECEKCAANYPTGWVREMVHEITSTVRVEGPVQVMGKVQIVGDIAGNESADVLYNRACDWLSLQDEAKAIEVLKEMVDKYPGDKRGWQKLAFILPIPLNKIYVETALKFDDVDFFNAVEKERLERDQVALTICNGIRKGGGMEWVERLFETKAKHTYAFSRSNHIMEIKPEYFDLPSVNEMLAENEENVKLFNNCWTKAAFRKFPSTLDSCIYYGSALEQFWKLKRYEEGAFHLHEDAEAIFILGDVIFLNHTYTQYHYDDGERTYSDSHWYTSKTLLSKKAIKQAFDKMAVETERRRANNLCLRCGSSKWFLTGKCSFCK